MRSIKRVILVIMLAVSLAGSQSRPEKHSYLRQAEVHETKGTVQIVANSPRPLAQVLDALFQKYGWMVDYEDPRFTSKMDLTESDGPSKQIVPSGGSFTVEFPANMEKEKVLQLVTDSYNKSTNPGRFELRKVQDTFAVIGVQARNSQGQLSPQKPLFDAPITVKKQKQNISDTLKLICQTLSKRTGTAITIGVTPRNLLDRGQIEVGGAQLAARDLVLQSLTLPDHQFYWRLVFDPGSKGYWLDIHTPQRTAAPTPAPAP